jgi:hypothetical protein
MPIIDLNLPPIFVVGAARSGTTLTGQILGGHPMVFSPGESHFFEDVWSRRDNLGSLMNSAEIEAATDRVMTLFGRYNFPDSQALVDQNVDRDKLVEQTVALGGGYAALYQVFMQTLAHVNAKQRFCDDTPKHLFHLDAIFDLFPDAKVIACIRDPRDFLSSYKNYWRKSTESDRVRALYHPIVTSLLWRSSANAIHVASQHYGPEHFTTFQYEQLVTQPLEEVRRLCDFLELEFSAELIDVSSNNSSFAPNTSGIFATSIGRWQTELEPAEVWWAQVIGRTRMKEFGYRLHAVKPSSGQLVGIALRTPFAFLHALRANKHKRGPMLDYLKRRVFQLAGK